MSIREELSKAPGKYSMVACTPIEKMIADQFRRTLKIPPIVHDDMIARQLRYCKASKWDVSKTKNYINQLYQDEIHNRLTEDDKKIIERVMIGYRHGR